MGHFSYTCKLTGLPICGSDPAVLIVMKMRDKLFDCSEASLKKYGKTCLVSNDGTQMKFRPVWFPIYANYDEYGGMDDIKHDDNTKALEEFYGLPIDKIIDIVTSGRKSDGYDGSLSAIKKPFNLPDDYVEGEDWFNRYQRLENDPMPFGNGVYPDVSGTSKGKYEGWTVTRNGKKRKATKKEYDADFKLVHEQYARYQKWEKKNPDPTDDYNKPDYEERYKELLTYSGMWVHGEVYDRLTEEATSDGDYDKLDLGTPELLNELGFKEIEKDEKEKRYNRQFQKGKLIVHSDGTWVHVNGRGIYTLPLFKEYCIEMGEDIEIDIINKKDRTEQIYDHVIPEVDTLTGKFDDKYKLIDEWEDLSEEERKSDKGKALQAKALVMLRQKPHKMERTIKYLLLNCDEYEMYNPMTINYFNAMKDGKLRDNLVRFWRFNHYMYCTGRYYDIVGTAPQDGEHKSVAKVLDIAREVLNKDLVEIKKYEDEDALMDSQS